VKVTVIFIYNLTITLMNLHFLYIKKLLFKNICDLQGLSE